MAYSPAQNTTGTSSLAHLATVYYKKRGLDKLQKKFRFRDACMDDQLPKQVGKTVQWYRYANLGPSTTPTVEGTIGTSQQMVSKIIAATVSQYTSFITVSDLLEDTALDPVVANAAESLGYQGGLTVDKITRTIFDNEFSGCTMSTLGTYFRVADLRNARTQLAAVDVEPFDDGEYFVIASPFITFDLVNDPAAGGLADIVKYTNPKNSPLVTYEDRGTVTHMAGCKVIESTNVLFTSGTPNKYRVYVFGKGAAGAVDLEGRGPNKVVDPKKQRFKVKVIRGGNNIADPEGVIGAACSYNFVYTACVLEGPASIGGQYRMRMFDAVSSVG